MTMMMLTLNLKWKRWLQNKTRIYVTFTQYKQEKLKQKQELQQATNHRQITKDHLQNTK